MKNVYNLAVRNVLMAIAATAAPLLMTAQQDSASIYSNSSWSKSTVITPTSQHGYWNGVNGVLPANGTYTLPALIGQPYPFHAIDSVEGAEVIKTDNNITYFKKDFMMDTLSDLSARIRLNVDDHAEIYVNGQLLVGIYDSVMKTNWKNPSYDAFIPDSGAAVNGYMGGDPYDSITTVDLDNIFQVGMNTIVVVCRNLPAVTNKGGFSFRLDIKGSTGHQTVAFLVSNDDFAKSTTVTQSTNSGNWSGVGGVLPGAGTFTNPALVGQPYSFASIVPVDGADVIKTGNNITYFRREFGLTKKDSLTMRFRMSVDDAMEVYINGHLVLGEYNNTSDNWKFPHDMRFKPDGTYDNPFMGGNTYDYVTSDNISDYLIKGDNELILVIRNLANTSNRGGFSFRLDADRNGDNVIYLDKSARAYPNVGNENTFTADLYPNPTSSQLSVSVDEEQGAFDVFIYDINGKLITSQTGQVYGTTLDVNDYAPGVYIVKVVSGDYTYTGKVMKQ